MRCVVCGRSIATGQEQYPNDWERVRKRFPCCGADCSKSFNPDLHWIPAVWPTPVGQAEEQRLLNVVHARINYGDNPSVILREMLQAGVSPEGLRRAVGNQFVSTARRQKSTNRFAWLGLLFRVRVRALGERRDASKLDEAFSALDLWEQARAARSG